MQPSPIDDPILPDVVARIRQAFLLGLARQPLTVPPSLASLLGSLPQEAEPVLAMLALAGQRQRFALPVLPPPDAVPEAARRLHQDARPIIAPPARRALSRLVGSVEKGHASSALSIAVRRIGEAGLRLHPFDLPALLHQIKPEIADLGLAERAFLALTGREAEESETTSLFYDTITAENWTTFPRARRRTFIADLRRTDAAAGRALVEAVWKSEPAPVRLALLEAIGISLGPDDKPFLDKLANDRADTVKQHAALLLARMPSSEGYAARLAEAARCFERPSKLSAAGILSAIGLGADTLIFKLPGDGKSWSEMQATRDRLFGGLSLPALAAAVDMPPEAIIAALPANEEHTVFLLLETALADSDMASAQTIVARRLLSGGIPSGPLLTQLVEKGRVMLSPDDAQQLIDSPAWGAVIQSFTEAATPGAIKDDGRLLFMAALMPRAAMSSFKQSLAPLSPSSSRAAVDFADFVLALPSPAT